MKHKLTLILIAILLCACNSDDASNSNDIERLIGQWRIQQRTVNGSQTALGECEPFSIYTYNENGTYTELHYAADANTDCLDNPSIEFNGSWQNNDGTSYSFTDSNNETSEVTIEFDSNNSFTRTFSVSSPDGSITIVEDYDRIE